MFMFHSLNNKIVTKIEFSGAILPSFDTVSIFCVYTAVGLVYVYLSTLFFFGAVLAYSHSITWNCNR